MNELSELTSIAEAPFQFNYRDKPEEAEQRFEDWLSSNLPNALERWSQQMQG